MSTLPISLRVLAHACTALILAFLVMPILALLPASLNKASFITLPPHELSFRWYEAFFADPQWRAALGNSLKIAVAATLFAVGLGTLAGLGLRRAPARARMAMLALFATPMIVPSIVSAVSIYRTALDVGLNGTFVGLSLSHAALALPFVLVNVEISLRSLDDHWLKAALGLGANHWTVFRTIILPHISPGLVGGAVFAFITSFDEIVMTIFMANVQTTTLPVKLWQSIRLEFTPVVAVAAVVVITLGLMLFLCVNLVSSRAARSLAS
jgi:putative spermidine/putrescine transport system permease protein